MSTATVDAIVLEITIQAPAARVFEALVDPAQRMKWWSREGRFETTNVESDLRPGGRQSSRRDRAAARRAGGDNPRAAARSAP